MITVISILVFAMMLVAILVCRRRFPKSFELLFLELSVVPILTGLVIPIAVNFLSRRPEANRPLAIILTRFSLLSSAALVSSGAYLSFRLLLRGDKESRHILMLMMGSIIAAVPLVITGVYLVLFGR